MNYALIVCGSNEKIRKSFICEIYKNASFVIGADSGANILFKYNLVPDLICGDMDSISDEVLKNAKRLGTEIKTVKKEKDFSDLDFALSILEKMEYEKIVILNALGGRTDHLLSNLGSILRCEKDVIILSENETIRTVHGKVFLKDFGLKKGDTFSIMSIDENILVTEKNVKYEVTAQPIKKLDSNFLSNIVKNNRAFIEVKKGKGLLITYNNIQ